MSAEAYKHICFTRPGGLAVTERALFLCGFAPGDKIADIGCGAGDTVRHMRDRHGLCAFGVDVDEEVVAKALSDSEGDGFFTADARALPFSDDILNGIFFECSLSKMDAPLLALEEAFRVLRPNGCLVVSDFFAGDRTGLFSGVLGCMGKLETWLNLIREAGFSIEYIEDFTAALRETWGQLVFDYGLERILAEPAFDADILRHKGHGYFLAVGKKGEAQIPS